MPSGAPPAPTTAAKKLEISWVGVVVYPPSSSFGPRVLQDYEFIWVMEGSARIFYDDQEYVAGQDSLLLGRPGRRDRYEWTRDRRSRQAYLHFELEPAAGWPPPESWPVIRQLAEDDLCKSLYRFLLSWDRYDPAPLPYREALELMLKLFFSGHSALEVEPHERLPEPVERALGMMHERLEASVLELPTLKDMANAAAVSPEHLCRLFKKHLQVAPREAMRLARLERAAGLLGRTAASIKEIAVATGFANQYHFSGAFKAIYGVSPSAYRKKLEAGEPVYLMPTVQHLRSHWIQHRRALAAGPRRG